MATLDFSLRRPARILAIDRLFKETVRTTFSLIVFHQMRSFFTIVFLSLASLNANEKPNIVLILADDLGFSDLGCYGAEIQTPHLDSLAEGGLRFTSFYNTARCWPTRAALMTGYYPQQVGRDVIKGLKGSKRRNRPSWAKLLPEFLKPAGYRSYHSGKWHIDGMPIAAGFDRSYYLKCDGRFFNPETHFLDDKKLPAIEKETDFYTTTEKVDRCLEFWDEHEKNHADQPFFTYLAFTAPHFPLHAKPEDIAKYDTTYNPGWEAIRTQRHKKQAELGFPKTALSPVLRDLGPPYDFPDHIEQLGPGEINKPVPWPDLTEVQKKFQATKMAIHAAMIDRMDQEIGRLIAHLKKTDRFENTLILFLSDNGASAEIMVRHDGHDPKAPMGSAPTYLCLGPGWATTSNTPFKKHKTWTHEGGVSTPLIAHWPKGITARKEFRQTPGHVTDFIPTVFEITGVTAPSDRPALPGKSLVPIFKSDPNQFHDHIWWCHDGHRAILKNGWKAVSSAGEDWELYHLAEDRTETKNLATENPQKLASLKTLWSQRTEQFLKDSKK